MGADHHAARGGKPSKKTGDPRGGHTRLYWGIQDSVAWQSLKPTSQALYMAIRRGLIHPGKNGALQATLATVRRYGWTSSSSATLASCLRELEVVGLIEKVRQGGIANGGKVSNLYRLTDEPVHPGKDSGHCMPKSATNEWKRWGSVREAKAAIAQAHREAKRPPRSGDTESTRATLKVRKLNRSTSVSEARPPATASISVVGQAGVASKNEAEVACA